ncbi:tyrosine-protein phosphatase [Streptomyces sp. NBC_01485]|uniref:tyrosine-protein phosphatase n=1 Tax=Streptomyces sp. NBC_01485 TaxID=2903884 RepID=UPI002E2F3F6D|nr:tyrosine-protein phosphatase [Streptomyces sp. NBC_01485]
MDRHIPFETVHNFRDLGGYPTGTGDRVRPGHLFRADSLGKLTPDTPDWDRFLSLGIRTVIDLRHPWEADSRGRIPESGSFTYHDTAALWQLARGIRQWQPGEKTEAHFVNRMHEGEVWLTYAAGTPTGAWELWWDDPAAWGPRPPEAGYIHRLMTTPHTSPPGTGRKMLVQAESRITATNRPYARLDCLSTNPRLRTYYESAGYRVAGEQRSKNDGPGSPYAVTLLEKRLT